MKQVAIFSIIILAIYISTLFVKGKNNSISFLDRKHTYIIKGIAILTVVWGHSTKMLNVDHIQMVAEYGVWLFLFCSGYGCYKSFLKNGLQGYWYKRITKVIIPFWLCEFAGLLVTGNFGLQKFFLDITFIKPATSYGWFMGFILLYYIVFWVSAKLCKTGKAIVASVSAFAIIAFVYFSTISVNPLFPALKARQVYAFPIGIIVAEYYGATKRWIDKSHNSVVAVASAGILVGGGTKLLAKYLETRMPYLISNGVALISAVLVSIGIVLISYVLLDGKKKILDNSFFHILGEYSFSLYMVHAFTLQLLNGQISGTVLFLAVTAVLTFTVHWLFNRIIPKIIRRNIDG